MKTNVSIKLHPIVFKYMHEDDPRLDWEDTFWEQYMAFAPEIGSTILMLDELENKFKKDFEKDFGSTKVQVIDKEYCSSGEVKTINLMLRVIPTDFL